MWNRTRLWLAGAGLLAAAYSNAVSAQTAAVQEVTIAVSSTSFVLGGVRIGENAGIFARNGIKPRIVVMESGNAALSALIGGSAPFAVTGPPDTLAAKARGQNVKIVANLYRGLAGSVVLAKGVADKLAVSAKAPIGERLRALDGLTIAVPSATSALLAPLRIAAENAGAKIKFTYMAQPAMTAALESGAIQGIMASFPFAGASLIRGTGTLWIDGPGGDLPAEAEPASSSCLLTMAARETAEPETVARLRKAIADTATFIRDHGPDAKRALAAAYPQLGPEDIDIAFAQQWRNWTLPDFSEADVAQELKLLKVSSKLPDLDKIDPSSILSRVR